MMYLYWKFEKLGALIGLVGKSLLLMVTWNALKSIEKFKA